MPQTNNYAIIINDRQVDTDDAVMDIVINWVLETPEDFLSKQGGDALELSLPCTKLNDQVFNTFHNAEIIDLTPDMSCRQWMDFIIYCNGVLIFKGYCILVDVTITDRPEYYNIQALGASAQWIIDMQNVTLWDCVSGVPHTFDVPTVENSWKDAIAEGFDSDIDHDYVYAPVRYRQPFGPNDDAVNIYALRPSISIYWMIQRAFNQLGFTVNSQFFNTPNYFRRFVLPWVWGDFYDIKNQLTDGLAFKAYGNVPLPAPDNSTPGDFYFGTTYFAGWGSAVVGTGYVFTFSSLARFFMGNTAVPVGYDNFGLYSFDETTGTMQWVFNPPSYFASVISGPVSVTFNLDLLVGITGVSGGQVDLLVEVSINASIVSTNSIIGGPFVGGGVYPAGAPPIATTTNYIFTVGGINAGDIVTFRLKYEQSGTTGATLDVAQSEYINVNPSVTGASSWQYNPVTQQWQNIDAGSSNKIWQLFRSTFRMTNLLLAIGGSVNFKNYDAFRNYKITDLLGGLVELFNLEVSTDPINKIVSFEPMFGTVLPDNTALDGWFSTTKILDWSAKRDLNKVSKMSLFSNIERQLDFSLKQDGSDGGQNIYSARYKGIYLNNVKKPSLNNGAIDNGIIAGIPGSSRYMLPDRFTQGNKPTTNRFFSATMHYNHSKWKGIDPAFPNTPAPQLICIFPENINDSSASAVTQTFEPKIAFYKGTVDQNTDGAWKWVGDPASPYTYPTNVSFELPKMFAVNYSGANCELDPALTYCDQNVGGNLVHGLMRRYFLRRFAIMRNGQLFTSVMRLNLNDICNWNHQESIKIGNSIYALISIDGYKPFADQSNECTLWRIVNPEQIDIANSYPSSSSVLTYPATLTTYDLRYAQLLLFETDIPQIG